MKEKISPIKKISPARDYFNHLSCFVDPDLNDKIKKPLFSILPNSQSELTSEISFIITINDQFCQSRDLSQVVKVSFC